MIRLLPTDRAWPLHDRAASRRVEATALAAHPPHALIERAGLAVARLARALVPHGRRAIVLAGPGNNGGDGLIAARHLAAAGWSVDCHLIGPDTPPAGSDADHALHAARAAGLLVRGGLPSMLEPVDLVIDAILGLGASRPPQGEIAAAIEAINASSAPRLSIDLPSGLDADTGQPLGDAVVRANHTLSLLTLKPGLFTGEGRALCGELWFDDLGHADAMTNEPATATLTGRHEMREWQRRFARGASSHKGKHGDVIVLGGAPGMRGAAWLTASAALTAGAGRVFASLPEDADDQPFPARPELMRWPDARWQRAEDWRDAVVVAGCGGGAAIASTLDAVLREARRLVLDADGLNLVAGDAALGRRLAARSARGLSTVLTPHPLEAARLLKLDGGARAVQADRLGAARALAAKFQSTVVLKGSGSVITTPESDPSPAINSTGSGALATAGTGDVLAGWIGGLWAQSSTLPPQEIAIAAVAWHGAAAEAHVGPMRAFDLIEAMARLHG